MTPRKTTFPPQFTTNRDLSLMTTIGLGGPARYFMDIQSPDDLGLAYRTARDLCLPFQVLGGGSNVVFDDVGFEGIVARILRNPKENLESLIEVKNKNSKSPNQFAVNVSARLELDEFVRWCVENEFTGLTALSGIPGTMGAAPVQNVGAYGSEISDTLESVLAFDLHNNHLVRLKKEDLAMGYRCSMLQQNSQLVVLELEFYLQKSEKEKINHLQISNLVHKEVEKPKFIRSKVLEIRKSKGMVQGELKSCGSFFCNPVLDQTSWSELQGRTSEPIPVYKLPNGEFKVPAAWLIEQAGFTKGFMKDGVGISPLHSLALIQNGTGTTKALLQLAKDITEGVEHRWGIRLKPEPLLLDSLGSRICLN